jgi:hypothetical protein
MQFFEDFKRERQLRETSPDFQDAMREEIRELNEILDDFNINAKRVLTLSFIKAPTELLGNALKTLYSKKYTAGSYMSDSFKLFFKKDGIFHSTGKLSANSLHLSGKLSKIGIRKLLAI